MADFNSSLPVRTQTNGDVVVEIADGTVNTQKLAIDASGRVTTKMDDGSGNAITSQVNGAQRALDVGIDVAGVQIDPRAIRALTSADIVTVDQGTTPWVSTDAANGPVTPGTAAGKSELIGGQFNTSLPTLTTGQQSAIQLDASGRVLVGSIASALPAGANLIGAVNLDLGGSPISNTNPLPVTITTSSAGTAIQNYQTSVALAAGSSITLTYTVATGHTFNLERVFASASGKIKAVIAAGASTLFAAFNSTATPNIDITVISPPTLAAASTVTVTITNEDLVAFDVYATIEGNQN